jgi:hypothetical protein
VSQRKLLKVKAAGFALTALMALSMPGVFFEFGAPSSGTSERLLLFAVVGIAIGLEMSFSKTGIVKLVSYFLLSAGITLMAAAGVYSQYQPAIDRKARSEAIACCSYTLSERPTHREMTNQCCVPCDAAEKLRRKQQGKN